MPRPIMHSHLTEHAAVARATAGKVLASSCCSEVHSTSEQQSRVHITMHCGSSTLVSPDVAMIVSDTE